MKKTKLLCLLLAVLISSSAFAACNVQNPTNTTPDDRSINGISLDEYTVIYDADDLDYSRRAAEYISSEIKARTNIELDVREESEGNFEHEIVVGETSRIISQALNADTENTRFAILADDNHIALEGDYFVIAAAAYFFVETYAAGEALDVQIPTEPQVHDPIIKEAKNFILLIGDGMGVNQTRLFETMTSTLTPDKAYDDGEDLFYGYLLGSQGFSRTNSFSGVTDSAAGGTALSTGYKTNNRYIGKNVSLKDVTSLTELAGSLGKATAVMSTESETGATPASFSAHANDRSDTDAIKATQKTLKEKYGTIINCNYNYYYKAGVASIEKKVNETLSKLSENENGFFLMYEEAHIDKYCHNNEIDGTFNALMRFNQIIGVVMEYAFYNPDTFVLITADHETGGLTYENGQFRYTSEDHSGADVPIFCFGTGSDHFNGNTVENVEIPKYIAKCWGIEKFGIGN